MKLCPRQARARLATFDTSCYSWLSWGHSVRPATMHREKNLSVSSLPYCCEVSLDLGSLSTLAWVASLIYLLVILKSPAFRYWLQLAKAALQDRRKVSKSDDGGGGAHSKQSSFSQNLRGRLTPDPPLPTALLFCSLASTLQLLYYVVGLVWGSSWRIEPGL